MRIVNATLPKSNPSRFHSNLFPVGTKFIPKENAKVLLCRYANSVWGMITIETCPEGLVVESLVRVGPRRNHIQATGLINDCSVRVRILVSDVKEIISSGKGPLVTVGDSTPDMKARLEKATLALARVRDNSNLLQVLRPGVRLRKGEVILNERYDLFDYLCFSRPLSEQNGYKTSDYKRFNKFIYTAGWGRPLNGVRWGAIVNIPKLLKWMDKNTHRVLFTFSQSAKLEQRSSRERR